jgi:hypothetical protein
MHPDLQIEWPIWRLVISGKASLKEIETHYNFDDVRRMNIMLDIEAEIISIASKPIKDKTT